MGEFEFLLYAIFTLNDLIGLFAPEDDTKKESIIQFLPKGDIA